MTLGTGIIIAAMLCCLGFAQGKIPRRHFDEADSLWKCELAKRPPGTPVHPHSRCYGVPIAIENKCKEDGGLSTVVEPTCMHTEFLSPTCHSNLKWAVDEGIKNHPEWYNNKLTPTSDLVDVLDVVAKSHPRICLPPCRGKPNDRPWPAEYHCHKGGQILKSRCLEGIPVTHKMGSKGALKETCVPFDRALMIEQVENQTSGRDPETQEILSVKQTCVEFGLRAVFRSPNCMARGKIPPECDKSVDWVLKEGMPKHPDWYPGLNSKSMREEIVDYLTSTMKGGSDTQGCLQRCDEYPKAWLPVKWPGQVHCVGGSA